MTDHALDALLAEFVAPPVPTGLAARVAAAALALPQEPRLAYTRRATAAPRRDRRGKWRRPLLIGGVAFGLLVSGAVAATLAGLRLDLPDIVKLFADPPAAVQQAAPDPAARPHTPPPPAPPVATTAPVEDHPVVAPAEREIPAPRAAATSSEVPPVASVDPTMPRSDVAAPRTIETPPAALLSPAPELARTASSPPATAERQAPAPAPVVETRSLAPAADDVRVQQQRIEQAERLRAARQAQIERLQRVQQRRERIRRLRRE